MLEVVTMSMQPQKRFNVMTATSGRTLTVWTSKIYSDDLTKLIGSVRNALAEKFGQISC